MSIDKYLHTKIGYKTLVVAGYSRHVVVLLLLYCSHRLPNYLYFCDHHTVFEVNYSLHQKETPSNNCIDDVL